VAAVVVVSAGASLVVSTNLAAGVARLQAGTLLTKVDTEAGQIDAVLQEPTEDSLRSQLYDEGQRLDDLSIGIGASELPFFEAHIRNFHRNLKMAGFTPTTAGETPL
jgi:hypothetical protein